METDDSAPSYDVVLAETAVYELKSFAIRCKYVTSLPDGVNNKAIPVGRFGAERGARRLIAGREGASGVASAENTEFSV